MTDFLREIPDKWMLLSIVQQYPNGIGEHRLGELALGKAATTGQIHEIRNRMLEHRRMGTVSALNNGYGGLVYKLKGATDGSEENDY